MARSGRSHVNRPVVVKGRYHLEAAVALAAFEIEMEWPAVTVSTPSARVLLGAFELEMEWPALTLSNGATASLAAFEIEMEWPELVISTPIRPGDSITQAGQVELNGTLWGPTTDFGVLLPVEGWRSMPQVNNLNVDRPNRHGAWSARKIAGQRLVTIRLQPNSASDPTMVDDLLDQIDSVTGLLDTGAPIPLVVRGYGAPQLVFGQVIDRSDDLDDRYNVGLPTVTILFSCADPRRYNVDRTGVAITAGATEAVINAGNTSTHPIVRIPGPATNPALSNTATGRTIGFTLVLLAGETLLIDADQGNATVDGDSVMTTLTGSSAPVDSWVLTPGTNPVTYTATGTTTPLTLLYRDAWI